MYARVAADYITAWCEKKWPPGSEPTHLSGAGMASTMCMGDMIDAFDIISSGSHKYIPASMLNEKLGLPQGAGVYSYFLFKDKSYLLLTCEGPLAYWSGKEEDDPKFT